MFWAVFGDRFYMRVSTVFLKIGRTTLWVGHSELSIDRNAGMRQGLKSSKKKKKQVCCCMKPKPLCFCAR